MTRSTDSELRRKLSEILFSYYDLDGYSTEKAVEDILALFEGYVCPDCNAVQPNPQRCEVCGFSCMDERPDPADSEEVF